MLVAFSRSHGFICRKVVGNQPVKLVNDLGRIARSEVEGELESFGLAYAAHSAGSHLAVASPVEVLPLARRLPRVVDRTAARQHQAEHARLEARRDGQTRYSAGNENAKEFVQATNPGFSWHKSAIDTWHPNWIHSNDA